MYKNIKNHLTLLFFIAISISCSKKDATIVPKITTEVIINDFIDNVAFPNYLELEADASKLNDAIITLKANKTEANLKLSQEAWKKVRNSWEQAESFLFGPVSTENLDPSIDDWPVNKIDFDQLLASNDIFTTVYIDNLQTSLKGFHSVEYIIFGVNSARKASEITPRMLDFALAITTNLKKQGKAIRASWDVKEGNFIGQMKNAGESSSNYKTRLEVLLDMSTAMANICEEVGEGKIKDPFENQNPELEESQFSNNSMTDFRNNIIGVQNVYLGKYGNSNGVGFNDFVANYNKSLDIKIQSQLLEAIASMEKITLPFGKEAIFTQKAQIQTAMNKLAALNATFADELISFLKLNVKD